MVATRTEAELVLRTATSDMGPGTWTSMTQVAGDALGLPLERVRMEIGDSALPRAPVHGGTITMASVGNAVPEACKAVQRDLGEVARSASEGPFAGLPAEAIVACDGGLARAEGSGPVIPNDELLRHHHLSSLQAEAEANPRPETRKFSSAAFSAVFVEVRVDEATGAIRLPRIVGAYDVGRVVNPLTARSQCIGGMVGRIGMALHERAGWDPRFGKVMNANLAEYLVPVSADVPELDVSFIPGDDRDFNPLGVKGLAEVAICGVAPAIASAVHHATGRRFQTLPITPESILGASES